MAVISGTNGNDNLLGTATNDIIFGFAGDDRLSGGGGADVLDGGTGADFMDGGAGNDAYFVDNGNDEAKEQSKTAAGGVDHVYASVTYDCYYGIENLTLTGSDQNNAVGNELNNIITGNVSNNQLHGLDGRDELWGEDANDTLYGGNGNDLLNGGIGSDFLDGGAGADKMYGDDGDDVYYVDHAGDETTEFVNYVSGGRDRVYASVSHTIGFGMEELVLTGSADINGTGGEGFNLIVGNSGNNILNGGAGADTMEGGAGNDIYVVDHSVDTVKENADGVLGGVDTVRSSVTHTLGFGFENLTVIGPAAIDGSGNENANVIIGNGARNVLGGLDGNDQLLGNGGDDILIGGNGDDELDGGSGNDTLAGGAGIDLASYSSAAAGVTVNLGLVGTQNTGGGGIDGLASIESLTGSNFGDTLIGNSASNLLNGLDGHDYLDGGAGADTMYGHNGNDTYMVDHLNDVTQEVTSGGLGGVDNVVASMSHTLGFGLENLTLTGTAALNGTGNQEANTIIGNSGSNVLSGLEGDDTLDGGNGGDDRLDGGAGIDAASYYRAIAGVTVNLGLVGAQNTGGGGVDQLVSIENLTGSTYGDALIGNGDNNVLAGLDGDDELNGGAGVDTMDGGAGNDIYVVDHVDDVAQEVSNNALSGVDSVVASVSHTLGYGIDYLYLRGAAALNGRGNENDNFISGNEANNELVGLDGNDSI